MFTRSAGNPSGAVKVERDFVARLDADLGVEPSAEFFSAVAASG